MGVLLRLLGAQLRPLRPPWGRLRPFLVQWLRRVVHRLLAALRRPPARLLRLRLRPECVGFACRAETMRPTRWSG